MRSNENGWRSFWATYQAVPRAVDIAGKAVTNASDNARVGRETNQQFQKMTNAFNNVAKAVEMETAALFATGFVSKVNIGALLLVSDCPLQKGGIKTKKSAKEVFRQYTDKHIELGIEAMADIADRGEKIRHYQW